MHRVRKGVGYMQNPTFITELLIFLLIIATLAIIYYFTKKYRKTTEKKNSYLEALELLADGDYRRAIQKFKESVKENTENIEAYLRLGDLLREKGLAKNALKIHKDLTFRSGLEKDFRMRVHRSLMLDYEAIGDLENTIISAKTILDNNGIFTKEAATKLINCLEKQEKWDEAYHACKKYFKNIPLHMTKKMALYLVFQGLDLLEREENREARIKFKEALKVDPECSPAYYYMGKSYFEENRLQEAIEQWTKMCKKIPKQAYIAFDDLERAWFELGNFSEAEKLYNSLLASDGKNVKAALALVEIYDKKGEYDRALEILNRLENNNVEDPLLPGYRIQVLYDKGQYKVAANYAINFLKKKNLLGNNKYICQECHYISEEPLWICPQCKSIDSFNI